MFASARWEWQYLPRNLPVGYKWCRSKADWENGRTGWLQQTAFRADVEKSSKKRTSLLPCPPLPFSTLFYNGKLPTQLSRETCNLWSLPWILNRREQKFWNEYVLILPPLHPTPSFSLLCPTKQEQRTKDRMPRDTARRLFLCLLADAVSSFSFSLSLSPLSLHSAEQNSFVNDLYCCSRSASWSKWPCRP